MKTFVKTALFAATLGVAGHAAAQITFYESDDYAGRTYTTQRTVPNFDAGRFNDRASSVVVPAGQRWEVCEDVNFGGRCMVLRPGNYPSLRAMGLNDRLSSARLVSGKVRVDDDRYAPAPLVQQDFRRRGGERLYEANVTSVRAVVTAPEQRCWTERENVADERGNPNVPGAVIGAVIGGILGHQVGGGTGKDLATVGGAVGGAAIGANVGPGRRIGGGTRDVQRCTNVSNGNRADRPEYWDVTYNFRGQEHRVQMMAPPGPTVTVNRNGEPRAAS